MASHAYGFDGFRLDPASRELRQGDEELPLQLKVFDCILYLIENRDRAVGREELIDAVWGDVHLSDSVLGKAISFARDALGDTGEDQRFIKTIRGYGYRWVAPVEVVTGRPVDGKTLGKTRPGRRWLASAAIVLVAVAVGALYLRRGTAPSEPGDAPGRPDVGSIALLLPVTVDANVDAAWMRLGLMDHIAERLRAAGQPVVPSDTVISLLGDRSAEAQANVLERLKSATGARVVLRARAEAAGARWRISLRSLGDTQPPLAAVGETDDVLAAARMAADRLALSLGLTPPPGPTTEPALAVLLQRAEAAMLAQQMEVARRLIETAAPRLRASPEARFLRARILHYEGSYGEARSTYESLLQAPPFRRDPILRARALHGLASTHIRRGELEAALPLLSDALDLLSGRRAPEVLGRVRIGMSAVALHKHEIDSAAAHLAHARVLFESGGDVQGLAHVESNRGVLEGLRGRYDVSLRHLERATEHYAALHDVEGELRSLTNMIVAHEALLAAQDALALEPHIEGLITQATNPGTVARGNLARVVLRLATGRTRAADGLLADVLHDFADDEQMPTVRRQTLIHRAERLAREGENARAARLAEEAVDVYPADSALVANERGRAWLTLVRTRLALRRVDAAADAARAASAWAKDAATLPPKLYAALARAEVAASLGDDERAASGFERALALADRSRVPLLSLRVVESYVPWLLDEGTHGKRDPARALLLIDRLAGHAREEYRVALLQLRVYHAVGIASAWRRALDRARSLAGDRRIPAELLTPPTSARDARDQPEVTRG